MNFKKNYEFEKIMNSSVKNHTKTHKKIYIGFVLLNRWYIWPTKKINGTFEEKKSYIEN